MKRRIIVIFLVFAIVLTGIIHSSCTDNSGYKKVTVTKTGVTFTFKCPKSYQDLTDLTNESDSYISFFRPNAGTISSNSGNGSLFGIMIYDLSEEEPDAKSFLDHLLLSWSELDSSQEFKLLERLKIDISGIEGEFVECSVRSLMTGDYLDSKISFVRDVYLDYKNKIWDIGVICYPEVNDQVKIEFNQIIKSFKFLN